MVSVSLKERLGVDSLSAHFTKVVFISLIVAVSFSLLVVDYFQLITMTNPAKIIMGVFSIIVWSIIFILLLLLLKSRDPLCAINFLTITGLASGLTGGLFYSSGYSFWWSVFIEVIVAVVLLILRIFVFDGSWYNGRENNWGGDFLPTVPAVALGLGMGAMWNLGCFEAITIVFTFLVSFGILVLVIFLGSSL